VNPMDASPTLMACAIAALAAGTFAFRYAGPALRSRVTFPPAVEKLLERSAVVLLTALVCTTALYEAQEYAGLARPLGVAAGGVLAWRGAPFLAVALAAVGTTAGLRWLGVR
jgi:branched-subunit amino acid transport protein